jgi:hypothetical protein
VPVIPASLIEPVWVEFAAMIGTAERPEFDPPTRWVAIGIVWTIGSCSTL